MRQRAPLVLSVTALVIAVFGTTPLGHAAVRLAETVPPFAKTAGFAKSAGTSDNARLLAGHRASLIAAPGIVPFTGPNGRLSPSLGAIGPQGQPGTNGAKGDKGDKGDTGSAGATTAVVRQGTPKEVGPSTTLDADCQPGERATGGGATVVGGQGQGRLVDSAPKPQTAGASPTGWRATAN